VSNRFGVGRRSFSGTGITLKALLAHHAGSRLYVFVGSDNYDPDMNDGELVGPLWGDRAE
jgi:hypothetical protein